MLKWQKWFSIIKRENIRRLLMVSTVSGYGPLRHSTSFDSLEKYFLFPHQAFPERVAERMYLAMKSFTPSRSFKVSTVHSLVRKMSR